MTLPLVLYCTLFVSLGNGCPLVQECSCYGFLLCFPDTVVAVNGIWILVETFMLQGRKHCSLFLDCDARVLKKRRLEKVLLVSCRREFLLQKRPMELHSLPHK